MRIFFALLIALSIPGNSHAIINFHAFVLESVPVRASCFAASVS